MTKQSRTDLGSKTPEIKTEKRKAVGGDCKESNIEGKSARKYSRRWDIIVTAFDFVTNFSESSISAYAGQAAFFFLLGIMVFGNMLRKMYFSNVHHIIGSIIGSVVDYRLVICLPVLILFFWVIYVFLPNKKHRAKYQLPGAVFAAAAWMIFSGIFSVYVDKYNNYSSFYGTMTTIALIMVWLYGCMYVLFIGGIINRTWEERMEAKKYYK